MRQEKDVGGKWYLEHHGDSVLKIAGLPAVESCRPVPPETILPRRIPDGLFMVKFQDRPVETPLIVEIESEPNLDADRQLLEDILLVRLTRNVFPDAILVLLKPRGKADVAGEARITSSGETVEGRVRWRVIRTWELQAEELFAMNDAGLVPFISLARTTQPPEVFLQRCRKLLDEQIPEKEHEEMLVVTSVFASIRYNEALVTSFFLGERQMINSPLLDRVRKIIAEEAAEETLHKVILDFLADSFGDVPAEIIGQVDQIKDREQLRKLIKIAATCSNLQSFVAMMGQL